MTNRKLTERELEILEMIRPTTFQDIVGTVRKELEYSRYEAKKELRNLRNGMHIILDRIDNGEICEAVI